MGRHAALSSRGPSEGHPLPLWQVLAVLQSQRCLLVACRQITMYLHGALQTKPGRKTGVRPRKSASYNVSLALYPPLTPVFLNG